MLGLARWLQVRILPCLFSKELNLIQLKTSVQLRRERNKKFLQDYLSERGCVICGEQDSVALEFDHIDLSTKHKNISEMVKNNYSLNAILLEIEKCRVLCANCHRRHTAKQFGWYK